MADRSNNFDQTPGVVERIEDNIASYLRTPTCCEEKAPPGFDNSLHQVCLPVTEHRDVSKVFAEAGFFTWLAYSLATEARLVTSEEIAQLNPETLRTIATHISTIEPDASVKRLGQHILWTSKRAKERRSE